MVIAIDIRLIGKKRTGDETVFFHLTKALLALDGENEYRLLTDERDPARLALLRGRLGCIGQANAVIVTLEATNRFFWNLVAVPRYLWRENIDVYHTQYIVPFFVPSRTKVVTLIHDVSFRAYPKLISWSDRIFLALLLPRSLKKAAKIIAVSQFTKAEIMRYYGLSSTKITVIPNAPQEIFREEAKGDIGALRKKYKLPEKYFLYAGTLQPRKNIPFLLSAFERVRPRLPEVKLVLMGSNLDAHNADRRIAATLREKNLENDVIFLGHVGEKDLPLVMKAACLFIFPTLYEGFGIPVLEAMSQGVPVIASDIPSLRETGGDAMVYVKPGDIATLAEKMYNLFIESETHDRSSLIERGKRRASLYSWKESASKLKAVYQSL